MAHCRRRICLAAGLVAILLMQTAPAVRADEGAPAEVSEPGWVRAATTNTLIYGSIYLAVVTAVQGARLVITAVTPLEWLATAQTFGTPLLVVPVIAQLVPAVRQWAPQAAEALERRRSPGID